MNTKSVPSEYRYCIPLRSTIASPTFTPALNVRSVTAPVFTFRSFVRTKAPPLPGFTCWNSTTWNRTPSSSRVMPFLKSFVETLTGTFRSELDQFACGRPDDNTAVVGDLHHVLDPDTAHAREVDPGLNRHHGAGRQRIVLLAAEARRLVDLEADPVPEAVHERVAVARALDHVAADGVHRLAGDTGLHGVDARLLGLPDDVMDRAELGRGRPERDRPRHVGVVAGGERPEVELDDVAFREGPVGRLVVRLGRVLSEGPDRIEREPIGALVLHRRLELARDLLLGHTDGEPIQDHGERRVGDRLGLPDRGALVVVLHRTERLDDVGRR